MCPPKGVILTTILHMSEISSCSSTTVVVTYTQTPPTRRHVTGTDLTGDGLLKGFNKHAKKTLYVRKTSFLILETYFSVSSKSHVPRWRTQVMTCRCRAVCYLDEWYHGWELTSLPMSLAGAILLRLIDSIYLYGLHISLRIKYILSSKLTECPIFGHMAIFSYWIKRWNKRS